MPLCPRCNGNLERNGEALVCKGCGSIFPVEGRIVKFLNSIPLTEDDRSIMNRYDTHADSYDSSIVSVIESSNCSWGLYIEKLETIILKLKNKIILDIGCGTAFPVGSLIDETSIYLGLDFSIEMLRLAQKLLSSNIHSTFFNIDSSHIPLQNSSVDVCLSLFTFNSLNYPEKTIKQIERVIREKGICLTTVMTDYNSNVNGRSESIIGRPMDSRTADKRIKSAFSSGWAIDVDYCGKIRFYICNKKALE